MELQLQVLFFFVQILFFLLWCSTGQEASSNVVLCIQNNSTCCRDLNIRFQEPPLGLFQLQEFLKHRDKKVKNITIILTAGEHYLPETLSVPKPVSNFSLFGSKNGNLSSIRCGGLGGILFNTTTQTMNSISIFDVILDNCSTNGPKPAAITLIRLEIYYIFNVTIRNTPKTGIYSERCGHQNILWSNFENNANSHIKIHFTKTHRTNSINSFINISHNTFKESFKSSSIHVMVGNNVNISLNLNKCTFDNNGSVQFNFTRLRASETIWKHKVIITDSNFMGFGDYGIKFVTHFADNNFKVVVNRSIFMKYRKKAVCLYNIKKITIANCIINSSRIGISIIKNSSRNPLGGKQEILNTSLSYNSKAIDIELKIENHTTILQNCIISLNNITRYQDDEDNDMAAVSLKSDYKILTNVVIKNSYFEKNYDSSLSCSALKAYLIDVSIQDSYFRYNNCTGIFLTGSHLSILGTLKIVGNLGKLGGGVKLLNYKRIYSDSRWAWKYSQIILNKNSKLVLQNNTATKYGGGIYIDVQCYKDIDCFFQFANYEDIRATFPYKIKLTANRAYNGGDGIFGGCLQHCYVGNGDLIDITNATNIFWSIADVLDDIKISKSASPFLERPQKVAFCSNNTAAGIYSTTCNAYHNISVYRGQEFPVELMIVDKTCFASTGVIQAKVASATSKLGKKATLNQCSAYKFADRYCRNYTYILKAPSNVHTTTLNLYMIGQTRELGHAQLHVQFIDCPLGFGLKPGEENCSCTDALKEARIECHSSDYTFTVPAMTWMGEVKQKLVVHQFCRRCRTIGKQSVQINHSNASYKSYLNKKANHNKSLCQLNRIGVLCGACAKGTSLKLGGYSCGFCSKSSYKGILLILTFAFSGLLLGLLLLKVNFTVSTGLISGLIFYSNVMYSSSDDYLKTSQDSNHTHLNNAVNFLYTFQAWVNLDFGINVCFFHGYDLYIATWMQFVFPFYLWLIIIVVIIVSKFSIRLSKFTGNNTIPALATMFLLSYTKLLTATIAASSYTKLRYLDSNHYDLVWIEDSNVFYLKGKHIPLFMVSILLLVFYLLPFSLLLILGPLLQSYSHYKVLSFINKIKPFLDSFYGPYTDLFRFWPGLLLLTRICLLNLFAYYSNGDRNFKLAAVIVLIILLFGLMGKTKHFSMYRNNVPNVLEMFFLFNLIMYSTVTLYFSHEDPTVIYKQQLATCVFVGSAFLLSCCILFYHVTNFAILQGFPAQKIKEKYLISIQRLSSWFKPPQRSNSIELDDGKSTNEGEETSTYIELREPLILS